MKIKEAQLHDLIRQTSKGEISFSRMVEILNGTVNENPIEPVFCPDCGLRIRSRGNGIVEQICICSKPEKWPPEPIVAELLEALKKLTAWVGKLSVSDVEAIGKKMPPYYESIDAIQNYEHESK